MTPIDRNEVRRYLGIRKDLADPQTEEAIGRCILLAEKACTPRSVTRRYQLTLSRNDTVTIETLSVRSRTLYGNLSGCTQVFLMAATLGAEADRLLRRTEARSMRDAVVMQAVLAAGIEQVCDEVNETLRTEAEKDALFCRPRFSPGYGDFPLSAQPVLLSLLHAEKSIGLTATDRFLLAPIKSVTAVIGLSKEPLVCKKGCAACDKTDCPYRRLP